MRIFSDGKRELSRFEKTIAKLQRSLKKRCIQEVIIEECGFQSVFICENAAQIYRAVSLWVKETGTMQWINDNVKPGDHFLDIGANVGIYTISAAHRAGKQGHVTAVEPHKPNAVSLMSNVQRNGFDDRTDILTCALTNALSVASFNYLDLSNSASGSQFGSMDIFGTNETFTPRGSELVIGISVDELLDMDAIQAPDLVKIDVDGIELKILAGMSRLLQSTNKPRSIQVELNVGEQDAIINFMEHSGYILDHRHFTLAGKHKHEAGESLENIAHNAVFIATNAAT